MKRLISLILITVSIFSFSVAFAAPNTVSANYSGNTDDLIVITNPEYQKTNTLEKTCVVSGYGEQGTTVGVYKLKDNNYNKATGFNIGASGLFMKSVELQTGKNSIMLVAEKKGNVQVEKLEINLLNRRFIDTIKNVATDIFGN